MINNCKISIREEKGEKTIDNWCFMSGMVKECSAICCQRQFSWRIEYIWTLYNQVKQIKIEEIKYYEKHAAAGWLYPRHAAEKKAV